jgi:alanyl aminopeptidase
MLPIASALLLLAFDDPKPPALRLPETVTPVRYAAQLRLIPSEENFSGSIEIWIRANEAVPVIWLHSQGLTIDSAAIEQGGKKLAPKVLTPEKSDFIGLEAAIGKGPGKVSLRYHGKVDLKNSGGLFRGKDQGNDYIYTQFEPIEARKAFPCFDEPKFKVPWQVSLTVKQDQLAFSNTPGVEEKSPEAGMKLVRFAETKPLPSYLIAFAVGPFEVVDAGKAGRKKTPIRMIVPKGRTAEAAYAVEVTGGVLAALENYFDIPYPYEKLDQVAVPLFGGAMENPGLITYSDTMLLGRVNGDTIARKRGYYEVAAHEIAHQWFGDLVTMPWWNDVWLNEAFATWMANKITAQQQPSWNIDVQRVNEGLGVMAQDALVSARRIRQPVESVHEINTAFDGITYVKGGAVVQMLETWMGVENFRKGVHNYMLKHAYGNARSEDFLSALASVKGGEDIPAAASTFIDQGGVPEVSISLDCRPGAASKPAVELEQRRFLPLGSKAPAGQVWKIPMCMQYPGASGGLERQCVLLSEQRTRVELTKAKSCPAWLLGNENMGGYYRTRYQGDLYSKLMDNGYDKLPLPVRVGLMSEAGAMAGAGVLSPADALRAALRVKDAPERQLVSAALALVTQFSGSVLPETSRPNLARFVQQAFGERARNLGWIHRADDSDDTRILRARLVPFVAATGRDPELIAKARELALLALADATKVPADLRPAVLRVAAEAGDRALFDRYVEAAKSAKDPRDRRTVLSSLSAFEDPSLMDAALDLFLKDAFDPRESVGLLFGGRSKMRKSFEFVKKNIEEAEKRMPADITGAKGAFLISTAAGFCSASEKAEAEALFGPRAPSYGGGPRALAQTLEAIDLCAARKDAQQTKLVEFLSQY